MPSVGRSQLYTTLRPRKSRAKTGCLACRTRRKKCDEQKPVCHSCQRLRLACSWPVLSPNEDSAVASSSEHEPRPGSASQSPVTEGSSNVSQPSSSSYPDKDEFHISGLPTDDLLAELRDLGEHLRESGVLSYNTNVDPEIREQIPAFRIPDTVILFEHFCQKTAPWLTNGDCDENPILKHIVPLTITDDLVLHTVLAMSGAYLDHSSPSIETLAMSCYSAALEGLRKRLSGWLGGSKEDYKPLLATIILLCHCEFLQGNTHGRALQHLRACREFIDVALEHLHDPDHRDFVVFLTEHYGYFILIADLRGTLQNDNIRLGLEFSTSIMKLIKDVPSFGSIFVFEPESFSLIPQIAQIAWQRKQGLPATDELCQTTYVALLEKLHHEQLSSMRLRDNEPLELDTRNSLQIIISFKINALLMYLHASFHEQHRTSTWITELLQPLIDSSMMLVPYIEEDEACYGLFWSALVVGSYVQRQDQQELLVRQLRRNRSKMPFLKKGIDLLQWLWEDVGNGSFGLTGLERVATAHGVHLCIC